MKFELIKFAKLTDVIKLPRVEFLISILRDVMVPLYAQNDADHPELAQLADVLADHFSDFDFDTKVFKHLRTRDPYKIFNSKLLAFKMSDLRALAERISGSSVSLDDKNILRLVNLVMDETIYITWLFFCRNYPGLALFAGAQGLSPAELIKTAAAEDDAEEDPEGQEAGEDAGLEISENPETAAGVYVKPVQYTGPSPIPTKGPKKKSGRYTLRNPEQIIHTFKTATLSQGFKTSCAQAYHLAHTALYGSTAIPIKSGAGDTFDSAGTRRDALNLMVLHLDHADFASNVAQNIKSRLEKGERPTINGLPLVPDPPLTSITCSSHHDWLSEQFGEADKISPSRSLILTHIGQDEDVNTSTKNRGILARELIFGKSSASAIDALENTNMGAHLRTGSMFATSPDELGNKMGEYLVIGLNDHVERLKIEGFNLDVWASIFSELKSTTVSRRIIEQALSRIVARLPEKFDSMDAAGNICSDIVKKEEQRIINDPEMGPKYAELTTPPARGFNVLRPWETGAKKVGVSGFLPYVAELVLKLPIKFSQMLNAFDPREAVAPIPVFSEPVTINVGLKKTVQVDTATLVSFMLSPEFNFDPSDDKIKDHRSSIYKTLAGIMPRGGAGKYRNLEGGNGLFISSRALTAAQSSIESLGKEIVDIAANVKNQNDTRAGLQVQIGSLDKELRGLRGKLAKRNIATGEREEIESLLRSKQVEIDPLKIQVESLNKSIKAGQDKEADFTKKKRDLEESLAAKEQEYIGQLKKAFARIEAKVTETWNSLPSKVGAKKKKTGKIARGIPDDAVIAIKNMPLDSVIQATAAAVFTFIGSSSGMNQNEISDLVNDMLSLVKKPLANSKIEKEFKQKSADLAKLVSGSFAEKYNGAHPQLVYSDYYNTVDVYRSQVSSSALKDSQGLQIEDPISTIGTKDFAIGKGGQTFGGAELRYWLMSGGSAIAKVKTIMSEAKARAFEVNEQEAKKWIENNVNQIESSGLDAIKTASIDETIEALKESGILDDARFSVNLKSGESLTMNLEFAVGSDTDSTAMKTAALMQNFLKKMSKSQLLSILKTYTDPRTGENFTESSYDALLTLISRQINAVFEDILHEKVLKRYSTKKVQQIVEGEGEDGADAKQQEIVNQEQIKGFVTRWMKYPAYQVKGALSQQSLPGFIGLILDSRDRYDSDDVAKNLIDHTDRILEKDYKEGAAAKKLSIVRWLGSRASWAVGHDFIFINAEKNLSQLLHANRVAKGSGIEGPVSRKEVAKRLGVFIDPLEAARKIADGDSKGDSYDNALMRVQMSVGSVGAASYEEWEKAAKTSIEFMRRRKFTAVEQSSLDDSDKDFLKAVLRDGYYEGRSDQNFTASPFSDEERRRLWVIGKILREPRSIGDLKGFLETAKSDVFKSEMKRAFSNMDEKELDKKIKSIANSRYHQYGFGQALDAAKSIQDEASRVAILVDVAKKLSEDESVSTKPYKKALDEYAKRIKITINRPLIKELLEQPAGIKALDDIRATVTRNAAAGSKVDTVLAQALNQFDNRAIIEAARVNSYLAVLFDSKAEAICDPDYSSLEELKKDYKEDDVEEKVDALTEAVKDSLLECLSHVLLNAPISKDMEAALEKIRGSRGASTDMERVSRASRLFNFANATRLDIALSKVNSGSVQLNLFMKAILGGNIAFVLKNSDATELQNTLQKLAEFSKLFEFDPESNRTSKDRVSVYINDIATDDFEQKRIDFCAAAKAALDSVAEGMQMSAEDKDEIAAAEKMERAATGSSIRHKEYIELNDKTLKASLPLGHVSALHKTTYEAHFSIVSDLIKQLDEKFAEDFSLINKVMEELKKQGKDIDSADEADLIRIVKQHVTGLDPEIFEMIDSLAVSQNTAVIDADDGSDYFGETKGGVFLPDSPAARKLLIGLSSPATTRSALLVAFPTLAVPSDPQQQERVRSMVLNALRASLEGEYDFDLLEKLVFQGSSIPEENKKRSFAKNLTAAFSTAFMKDLQTIFGTYVDKKNPGSPGTGLVPGKINFPNIQKQVSDKLKDNPSHMQEVAERLLANAVAASSQRIVQTLFKIEEEDLEASEEAVRTNLEFLKAEDTKKVIESRKQLDAKREYMKNLSAALAGVDMRPTKEWIEGQKKLQEEFAKENNISIADDIIAQVADASPEEDSEASQPDVVVEEQDDAKIAEEGLQLLKDIQALAPSFAQRLQKTMTSLSDGLLAAINNQTLNIVQDMTADNMKSIRVDFISKLKRIADLSKTPQFESKLGIIHNSIKDSVAELSSKIFGRRDAIKIAAEIDSQDLDGKALGIINIVSGLEQALGSYKKKIQQKGLFDVEEGHAELFTNSSTVLRSLKTDLNAVRNSKFETFAIDLDRMEAAIKQYGKFISDSTRNLKDFGKTEVSAFNEALKNLQDELRESAISTPAITVTETAAGTQVAEPEPKPDLETATEVVPVPSAAAKPSVSETEAISPPQVETAETTVPVVDQIETPVGMELEEVRQPAVEKPAVPSVEAPTGAEEVATPGPAVAEPTSPEAEQLPMAYRFVYPEISADDIVVDEGMPYPAIEDTQRSPISQAPVEEVVSETEEAPSLEAEKAKVSIWEEPTEEIEVVEQPEPPVAEEPPAIEAEEGKLKMEEAPTATAPEAVDGEQVQQPAQEETAQPQPSQEFQWSDGAEISYLTPEEEQQEQEMLADQYLQSVENALRAAFVAEHEKKATGDAIAKVNAEVARLNSILATASLSQDNVSRLKSAVDEMLSFANSMQSGAEFSGKQVDEFFAAANQFGATKQAKLLSKRKFVKVADTWVF